MKRIFTVIMTISILMITASSSNAAYDTAYAQHLYEFYQCLDEQADIFDSSEEEVLKFRFPDFTIGNPDYDVKGDIDYYDARKVMTMICAEHPRLMASINFCSILYATKEPEILTGLALRRYDPGTTYAEAFETCDSAADDILGSIITEDMSDMEKAFAVYSYLVNECSADTDKTNRPRETIYGIFVNKQAACGGFANAFQLMMDKLGIECETIYGHNENHIWNYIKIDEKWYQIDAMWGASSTNDISRYKYFLMSDQERADGFRQSAVELHDWDSINPEVICDTGLDGYIFRDSRFKATTIDGSPDNGYRFTIGETVFIVPELKLPPAAVSLPLSNASGNTVTDVNELSAAHIYSINSAQASIICAFYDEQGRLIGTDISAAFSSSDTISKIDIGSGYAASAEYAKIFTWDSDTNSMLPMSDAIVISGQHQ